MHRPSRLQTTVLHETLRQPPVRARGMHEMRSGSHPILHRSRRRPTVHLPGVRQRRTRQVFLCSVSTRRRRSDLLGGFSAFSAGRSFFFASRTATEGESAASKMAAPSQPWAVQVFVRVTAEGADAKWMDATNRRSRLPAFVSSTGVGRNAIMRAAKKLPVGGHCFALR